MKKAIAVIISVVGLLVAIAATASAAVPVTKVANLNAGWADMSVKPSSIYFGVGGSPFFSHLKWHYWHNGVSAYASGRLNEQVPGCETPIYKCPYMSEPATVYLHTVKDHNGLHYFQHMIVKFMPYGGELRLVGTFKIWGGTEPLWGFPLVWPYL
jgi:hypothetical protein